MSRVLGWLRWLSAFLSTRHRLACIVRDHALERLALKSQIVQLQGEFVIQAVTVAAQHAEAKRMANVTARALDELQLIKEQLGRKSMNNQEVTP